MAIDFRIADYFNPLLLARYRRRLERTQWLTPERLRDFQAQQLRIVVKRAWEKVPYYRELMESLSLVPSDIAGPHDLERFPVLIRDDLRAHGERLVAVDWHRFRPYWHTTSGSTGDPVRFLLDRHARALEFCYHWRYWGWAGYRLGQPFAELASQYFLSRPALDGSLVKWQPVLRRLLVNSHEVSPPRVPEVSTAVGRYRPRFLKGTASALYALALAIGESKVERMTFDAVFSNGEVLNPLYRKVLEDAFGCRVLDSYGHMERTVGICQCPHGSYHVNQDYGLLQVVDVRPLSPQTALARVVGTSLYNRAMPLIRYDVGDDVEVFLDERSCTCGRRLPLVKAVHGRSLDTLRTPDGRYVTSMFLLFEQMEGVRVGQVLRESPCRFLILVVPDKRWGPSSEDRLRDLAHRLFGPSVQVRIRCGEDRDLIRDPSGKLRTVVGASSLGDQLGFSA